AHFSATRFSLTQVEYRIGCHSEERLAGGAAVGYPHLAVRVRLLRVADFAELGDVRTSFQFLVLGSQLMTATSLTCSAWGSLVRT
ncbi:MAG: hypothetical protein WAN70_12340, partial [Terriglobales bacterium]